MTDSILERAHCCRSCGHAREAHQHYRPGSECSLCDCPRFRRRWWPF